MTTNILIAIKNIINNPVLSIQSNKLGVNRANNMGDALEEYIKDAFAGTINEKDENIRNKKIQETFSYLGNTTNPPDSILKGGDAIEVKKIQSKTAELALNSSYPKNKLHVDDTRITEPCKICEEWTEKDIIYAVGYVNENKLKYLWLVYGDCYAANRDIYQRIADTISNCLENINDIELAKTNELGGVKKVDPLGITNLRIRGMWHIKNPCNVFSYIINDNIDADFKMYCLMTANKYNSFPANDKMVLKSFESLKISDVKVKNPDNPAQLLDCKLMEYYYE